MISDDEYLERIVAGIQSVTTIGDEADVTWSEILNGRQFDVVVRFKIGTLRYLVLIEVRNRTRKATASDMDAFVLKARDNNANKSVFVTAAGFQEGAINVAKRHAVDLFTITFDETAVQLPTQMSYITLSNGKPAGAPQISFGAPTLICVVEAVTLVYDDGREFVLPDEQTQMEYYVSKTTLSDGRALREILQVPSALRLGENRNEQVRIEPPLHVYPPDAFFFPSGIINSIKFSISGESGVPIRGNIRMEPTLLRPPVVYTNVLTGEASEFALDQLPLGVKRVSPGNFYCGYHPLRYYYCDSVKGSLVCWYLVESFQNGDLFQTVMTQDIKYSYFYIPVSDKRILERLSARLDSLKKLQRRASTT